MRKSVSEKSNDEHERFDVAKETSQEAQCMIASEEVQGEGSQLERKGTVSPFHGFSPDEIPLKKIIPVQDDQDFQETLDDIFGKS